MLWLTQFFGRFHPLLVHLPIGILFLAFLFECLSRFKTYKKLGAAVQPALLWGTVFGIASVISGYFLSHEGGYEERLLGLHRVMAFVTVASVLLLYFLRLKSAQYFSHKGTRKLFRILIFLPVIALLSITGHLGGSMTHGEDYLTIDFEADEKNLNASLLTITDVGDAKLYSEIVEPILKDKCYACHSSKKRKGELRLDEPGFIERGGKHGAVIKPGPADSSALYSRLILPVDDDQHMPPKERPQLSFSEIALIKAWLDEGANFEKKVKDFTHAAKIEGYFTTLVATSQLKPLTPDEDVKAGDPKVVQALLQRNIQVTPVSLQSNYLSARFVNAPVITDSVLRLLIPLKKQLVSLNLGSTTLTNDGLKVIAQLPELRKLQVDHTEISDEGLSHLASLQELNYLNLVGTQITDNGLMHLASLKKLRHVFLYQTEVSPNGIKELSSKIPAITVDTGGYSLPRISSDTTVFKKKS